MTQAVERTLLVEPATFETVRPFGYLVDLPADDSALPTAFYEDTVRVVSPFEFTSDHDTEVTIARINRRPLTVQWMERHFKHTQAFIPLEGRPFIAVLAPPTAGDLPSLDEAKALLFDGSAGFAMKIGTWHEFPFAVIDRTKVVVLLRREATRSLLKAAVVDGEAFGPDLDKKDIQRRFGVSLRVLV